jgi:hypothetical protein
MNVGHSKSSAKSLSRFPIGTVAEKDAEELQKLAPAAGASDGGGILPYLLALAVLAAALAWQFGALKQFTQ